MTTVDPNAVLTPWEAGTTGAASTEDLYRNFVGKSCRTCHVALDSSINWDSYAKFRDLRTLIHIDVCTAKVMPHANITFKNLWLSESPHGPDVLESYTGPGWPASVVVCDP